MQSYLCTTQREPGIHHVKYIMNHRQGKWKPLKQARQNQTFANLSNTKQKWSPKIYSIINHKKKNTPRKMENMAIRNQKYANLVNTQQKWSSKIYSFIKRNFHVID